MSLILWVTNLLVEFGDTRKKFPQTPNLEEKRKTAFIEGYIVRALASRYGLGCVRVQDLRRSASDYSDK